LIPNGKKPFDFPDLSVRQQEGVTVRHDHVCQRLPPGALGRFSKQNSVPNLSDISVSFDKFKEEENIMTDLFSVNSVTELAKTDLCQLVCGRLK
jgi:hypothetical protein